MKNIITILFFTVGTSSLLGQPFNREYGKLGKAEISLEVYAPDTLAEAVILFDIGKTEILLTSDEQTIYFTRKKRVKILKDSGIKYSEISIPLYFGDRKLEQVKAFEGTVYNSEGGKMVKSTIGIKDKVQVKESDHWFVDKYTFPNVKVGSIIEFSYTVATPYFFNLPDWQFQDRMPTVYSEYKASLTPFYEYVYLVQGISKFNRTLTKPGNMHTFYGVEYQEMDHVFVMENVPAFRDESYIASVNDYIMKIDFQLAEIRNLDGSKRTIIGDWDQYRSTLLKHGYFGSYLKRVEKKARDKVGEIRGKDELETTRNIIQYVKNRIKWNDYLGKYASKTTKEVEKDWSGNVADINLYAIGMLRAAGIKAYPVLLSTRGYGKVATQYPVDNFFNYVSIFVELGEKAFVTDATNTNVPFNQMPFYCYNGKGYLVREEDGGWIDLVPPVTSSAKHNINLQLDVESNIVGVTDIAHFTGKYAYELRDYYEDNLESLEEHVLDWGLQEIEKVKTQHYDNKSGPYVLAVKGEAPFEMLGDRIVLKPMLNIPSDEMPFSANNRSYPIDLITPVSEIYNVKIQIPAGYELSGPLDSISVQNDLVDLRLKAVEQDGVVSIEAVFDLKKSIYQPEYYTRIKHYFKEYINIFNQSIVLVKTGM